MAKNCKMKHKQIMARNGISFYNWPKFSETANKVVKSKFQSYLKNCQCHIYYLQKEETIYPTRLTVKK